jgi:uncharacterized protein YkwD
LVAGALATILACGGAPRISSPEPTPPPPVAEEVARFAVLVNAHRLEAGCQALRWDEGVARVAQAHSADMAARGFFGHQNPDGKSPFDRLRDGGIAYSAAAENIAYGTSDAERVLALWLGSPHHRANIENCGYTRQGVGMVGGKWTQVFITP